MIGETSAGKLVHIELQSTNQSHMARRMLEYSLAIHRKFHRFPEQIVLYVGNAPLRMRSDLEAPGLSFEYKLVDIREVESEALLASGVLDDNIIGILGRFGSRRETVRRVLGRIGDSEQAERGPALAELMVLAGLRGLEEIIEREIEQMPILDDIMDHKVLGRERKRGIALGRAEGLQEGERRVVLRMIARRFGPVPEWAEQRIQALVGSDLEQVELRLLDATSLEDLLP